MQDEKQEKPYVEEWLASPRKILPLLTNEIPITSVLDVGCYHGAWLKALMQMGVEDVVGVDVWEHGEKLLFPHSKFVQHDLKDRLDLGRPFDLCMCLEVAEHVEDEYSSRLIEDLCRHSSIVLFSAALPGQGGEYHVNERWLEYWIVKFEERGYKFCDPIRPRIWNEHDVYWWYRQNCVVFAHPDVIKLHPVLARSQESWMTYQFISLIHPENYKRHFA